MNDVLQNLAKDLGNFLVYLATGMVFVIGLVKCILPVSRAGRRLRKGIRKLEVGAGAVPPVWQDTLFLGKAMQGTWRRFLVNAEQLDARGINCNVEDYVNDDTVIYSVGHAQLADAVPGLLTSLGILGTFIGLMQGLGGLDVSDAAKTMESIPQMIGGMTYAFTTSIAGIACSLIFSVLNRMAHGSATRAIDDFNDAFADIVMQKPLETHVQMILQQEDRTALIRHISGDMANRVSEGIVSSVERTLTPVAQQMNQFIMGQTQAQLDGVNGIVESFIQQMNRSLNGQFLQLGKTLSSINQAQSVSYDTVNTTMAAADEIMKSLQQVQNVTRQIMTRFDEYVQSMDANKESNEHFLRHGNEVLSGVLAATNEQADMLENIRASQKNLQQSLRDYAQWSSQVTVAVNDNTQQTIQLSSSVSKEMNESARKLSDNYASFVDTITGGFAAAMGRFEENVNSVLGAMHEKMAQMQKLSMQQETEGCAAAMSQLQVAIREMTDALKTMEGK
ncbi:MAG: MotA/TolQ/ExbB proton channel family protein [Clostridia bacterium]|nr:MotA/TolQ/ExbB proton channel family protein [Clostridia bacterium]